jgi:hypothetical protein
VKAIVVPRGLSPAYYRFMRITAEANAVDLIVDRRVRERRSDVEQPRTERRALDRRAQPPPSWTRDGFVVVPGFADPSEQA